MVQESHDISGSFISPPVERGVTRLVQNLRIRPPLNKVPNKVSVPVLGCYEEGCTPAPILSVHIRGTGEEEGDYGDGGLGARPVDGVHCYGVEGGEGEVTPPVVKVLDEPGVIPLRSPVHESVPVLSWDGEVGGGGSAGAEDFEGVEVPDFYCLESVDLDGDVPEETNEVINGEREREEVCERGGREGERERETT